MNKLFSIRIPADLYLELQKIARREERSVGYIINKLLKQQLNSKHLKSYESQDIHKAARD